MMLRKSLFAALFALCSGVAAAQTGPSQVWCADCGDGTFRNPILHADYSDPDVVRVGDDYWMTASSFNCVPGLPILHSRDLVNWTLVNHALPRLAPAEFFAAPQHGKGVWAPCIKYHDGYYYIYWGDPDFGIFMTRTNDPRGRWSEPLLVKAGKGLIDPSPLWDDDGRVWLAHAWAASRSGVNSIITLVELDASGSRVISDERIIFDGNVGDNHTVEGAKLYKRNGWYYLFAPAGGVATGWQIVARSRTPDGLYEARTVMAQGSTDINGPHQGAWVETPGGESWFLHFQDKGLYGRVVHLNPLQWSADGWCVIGSDPDGDGCGEPVTRCHKPGTEDSCPVATPQESDEFDSGFGPQWQWHANPQDWFGMPGAGGCLRMYACRDRFRNFWTIPNLLLQKFPAERFTATALLRFASKCDGDSGGLIVMGYDYARLAVTRRGDRADIELLTCRDADRGTRERRTRIASIPLVRHESGDIPLLTADVWFRVEVSDGGVCRFFYSTDGERFHPAGNRPFTARAGKWIGAKTGLFCVSNGSTTDRGWIDADWFRITKNNDSNE